MTGVNMTANTTILAKIRREKIIRLKIVIVNSKFDCFDANIIRGFDGFTCMEFSDLMTGYFN